MSRQIVSASLAPRTRFVAWIGAEAIDSDHLRSLGVDVGRFDSKRHCFTTCRLDQAALDRLAPYDGVYTWGVATVEERRAGVGAGAAREGS